MAERVTGGRPQHGRVGKSSATREELEEAQTTHGAHGRKPLEARLRLGLLLGPSFLRDARELVDVSEWYAGVRVEAEAAETSHEG